MFKLFIFKSFVSMVSDSKHNAAIGKRNMTNSTKKAVVNFKRTMIYITFNFQLELPRPIPPKSVESDHRCTLSMCSDNAGNYVTLTLFNVSLTLQKPC